MNKFTNEQRDKFKPTIQDDAWINTALLGALLLSAFLKQQPAGAEIGLLFITWVIYRAQQRELNLKHRALFSMLNTTQLLIMTYAAVSVLAILSHIIR